MLGRWLKRGQKHRADTQQGDPHALDVEGDPRGGVQSELYRSADPRELVEDDGVLMAGRGGAPQEVSRRTRADSATARSSPKGANSPSPAGSGGCGARIRT
jgi:hypothetical protein